jgi:hypothetical protein
MARFEGSKTDKAQDKKEAKKRGMSLKQWENSAADRAMDKKGAKKMKKKKKA